MVRGISGGQKKRVTTAEMLVGCGCLSAALRRFRLFVGCFACRVWLLVGCSCLLDISGINAMSLARIANDKKAERCISYEHLVLSNTRVSLISIIECWRQRRRPLSLVFFFLSFSVFLFLFFVRNLAERQDMSKVDKEVLPCVRTLEVMGSLSLSLLQLGVTH
jgi:hypothetical protein